MQYLNNKGNFQLKVTSGIGSAKMKLLIPYSNTTVLRLLRSDSSDSSDSIRNCCTILALPISSEIMDGFWCSRCLNNHINLPKMIGSFASGATASLVAKNGTNKLYQLFEDGFWFSRCLNDHIEVPDMIGSFASSATASLVAKNGTKKIIPLL